MYFKNVSQFLLTTTFIICLFVSIVSTATANQAPDCTNAYPSQNKLWPPNHKYQSITINGLYDPDGGEVTSVIQCIKQDEPLNSSGDGNTAIDGSGIGTSTAFIRKERKGNSNGRVYHISYIATDNDGAQCAGTVKVSVPKSKKKAAIDEGPIYDSVENNPINCGLSNLNSPPSVSDQSVSLIEDEDLSVELIGSDPDGDNLSFNIDTNPTNGVITGDLPNLVYTPNANFYGEDSFTYIANDGQMDSELATISISISPVNDQPISEQQSLSLDEDADLPITLSASDVDNDAIDFQLVSGPSYGSLSGALPDLLYTPNLNFNGIDSIIFKALDGELESDEAVINITVNPVNDAPTANSQQVITNEDNPLSITLFGNDIENNPLTYTLLSQPNSGTLTGTAPNLVYTPNEDFNGSDTFTFLTNDGSFDSTVAYVSIFINSVNDLPKVDAGLDQTVIEGDSIQVAATATDSDGQIINQRWEESGQILGNNLSLSLDSLSVGDHVLTVIVTDNEGGISEDSLNITIEAKQNVAPEAFSENLETDEDVLLPIQLKGNDVDSDPLTYSIINNPTNGVLLGLAPNVTYRPNSNFSGGDSFSFVVNDGEITSTSGSISITVNPINDAPTINAGDDKTVLKPSSVSLNAIAKDVEGSILNYQWKKSNEIISDSQGFVIIDLNVGEHLYTVTVSDDEGLTATDSVKITVEDDQAVAGSLVGTVVDETGVMISNAKVSLPTGESAITDNKGNYVINGVKPIERTTVTASRSGFLKNSDIIKIVSGMQTQQKIVMSRPQKVAKYDPNEGSIIESDDGLTIEIPSSAEFIMESGQPFEGDVMINTSYFPLTTEEGVNEFPGDTMAVNDNGEMGDLTSFGIIKLEAKDQSGNPLELEDGVAVEVSIPADDSFDKPATIPFWYFDEQKGMWVADGEATYDPVTNTYRTSVDRVATFNLDLFAENVIASLNVCIEDSLGNKIPGYITLAPADSNLWRNTSKTSIDGLLNLNGIVAESTFNLYASTNDGRLGEYSNNPVYLNGGNNDLSSTCIVINDDEGAEALQLTGSIVDTSGNAKPNVELMIFGEAGGQSFGEPSLVQIFTSESDANGNFTINIDANNPVAAEVAALGNKRIVIKAIDGDTKASTELILEKGQIVYNLDNISLVANIPPFANAGVDITQYLNAEISLTAEKSYDSDGSIVSYEWRESDATLGATSDISFTGLGLGEHIVVLTVTDNFGLKSSDEILINIIEKPIALLAAAGNDRTSYLNEDIVLDGSRSISLDSPIQYEWSKDDVVLSNSVRFTYNVTDPLQHTITLRVTNSDGIEDTDTVNITVVEKSSINNLVNAGLDKSIYLNEVVTLTGVAQSATSSVSSVEWSESGSVLSNSQSFDYTGLVLGMHNIDFKATFNDGSVSEDRVKVSVFENNSPTSFVAYAGRDRNIVFGAGGGAGQASFGAQGFPANKVASYEWSINGEVLSNARFFTYNPTSEIVDGAITLGKRVIDLKLTSIDGVIATDQVEVQVRSRQPDRSPAGWVEFESVGTPYSIPPNSLSSVTVEKGGTAFFPENIKLPLTEIWTVNDFTTVRQIDFPEAFQNFSTLDYDFSEPGFYFVRYTLQDAEGKFFTARPNYFITVHDEDQQRLEEGEFDDYVFVDAGFDENVYLGDTVALNRGNSYSMLTPKYEWKKDGQILFTGESFNYTPTTIGEHRIELTVTETYAGLNVSETDEKIITVFNKQNALVIADAGLDQYFYVGSSDYIDGSGTADNGISKYEWKEDDVVLSNQFRVNTEFLEIGEHTLTLTVTDAQGNIGTDEVKITIIEPELSIFADAGLDTIIFQGTSILLDKGNSFSFLNNGDINYKWSEGQTVLSESVNQADFLYENTILGDHTLTLTITDAAGLVDSDEVIITIKDSGLVDIVSPVITINGEKNITINVGDVYEDQGATAVDNRDGVITGSIVVENPLSFSTFTPGVFLVTYRVRDITGNETSDTRQVTVLTPSEPDVIAPIITIVGSNPISVPQGRIYSDAGATVRDNRDGTMGYSYNTNVNEEVPGTYQSVYTATDRAGNTSEAIRTINVIEDPNRDMVKPVITLIGEPIVYIPQGEDYIDEGATALDNIDGDISSQIVINSTVNSDIVGQYFVAYGVRDTARNESIIVTRIVIVTKVETPDILPPILVQSLEWLETQSQTDGSYTNSSRISLPIQSTSEVLRAYHLAGEELALGIDPAIAYLNENETNKIEYLSRKIISGIEAGNDVSIMILDLLELQNIDSGFGDQGNYHSRVIDTAFVLKALGVANYNDTMIVGRIIDYLKTQQSFNDGGFSHSSRNQSSVYETSLALIALQNYQDVFDLKSMMDAANQYLMNNQIAGGGWDTHWETAYALIAVTPTVDNYAAYQNAADRLKTGQLANGSWDNDVYTTALVIRALYKTENLDTP